MSSREIGDLQPDFAARVRELATVAAEAGLDLLIYCTLRTLEEQARLWRQSRPAAEIHETARRLDSEFGRRDLGKTLLSVGPQHGPHVTNAAPGQSAHNYGLAIDAVPLRDGKPVWGTQDPADMQLWQRYGALAVDLGLEWAGNWRTFREYPHVQAPGFDWREAIREAA